MKTPEHIKRWRGNHHAALEQLARNGKPGLTLWRSLRRVEARVHKAAEDYCNGVIDGDQFDKEAEKAKAQVLSILGRDSLPGLFVNSDARGYALKLRTEKANDGPHLETIELPKGLQSDWGGYGILAATIA